MADSVGAARSQSWVLNEDKGNLVYCLLRYYSAVVLFTEVLLSHGDIGLGFRGLGQA